MICVSLMPENEIDAIKLIRSCGSYAKAAEIRLDLNPDIDLSYIANAVNIPVMATCLTVRDGGKFDGNPSRLIEVLLNAAKHKIRYLTVNHHILARFPFGKVGRGIKVIAACHNPKNTPANLQKIVRSMQKFNPSVVKIACRANRFSDNIRMSKVKSSIPFVSLCTGEKGMPSRILYKKFNSPFTFGYPADSQATADGQLSVKMLSEIYRADRMNSRTRVYALFGNPVSHSAGPNLFNFQFEQRKINAAYVPFHVDSPREIVAAMREFDIRGASVTAPFKISVIPYLDGVCEEAEKIGAVNTIRREGRRLIGHNTDWSGFRIAILEDARYQELVTKKTPPKVLIIGAGGAARAVIYALYELIAPDTYVYNRTEEKAEELSKKFGCVSVTRNELTGLNPDIIINTSSREMNPDSTPPIDKEHIPQNALVFDTIYNPPQTGLLKIAAEKNCPVQNGLNMFLFQAHHQLLLWGFK